MKFESLNKRIAQLLIAAVFTTFCGITELAEAQAADPQSTQQQSEPAQQSTEQPPQQSSPAIAQPPASTTPSPQQDTTTPSGTVDPSAGPLAPVPSTQQQQQQLPNAPSSETREETATPPPTLQQPVGAAGAQVGPTAGGLAAKPAGNAIAPAKQRQVRSFLIKLGAVAAVGAAIGTVVALSRGTSSTPPGAR